MTDYEFILEDRIAKIKLCELYYEPYNFDRTGCVGCPYNKDLKKDLELLKSIYQMNIKSMFDLATCI